MGILPTEITLSQATLTRLIIVIHGVHKSGKSSLAAKFPGVLFVASEPGLNHLDVFQVTAKCWEDLLAIAKEFAAGNHNFQALVLDTIDNLWKFCADFICRTHGVKHESDLPHGKGWGFVTNEFHRVLLKLAQLPYGLIMISHSKEKEVDTRTGKIVKTIVTLPPRASEVALGLSDLILMLDTETTADADGKRTTRRVIRTKPHQLYQAGDRTGKLPEMIDQSYEALASYFDTEPDKENDVDMDDDYGHIDHAKPTTETETTNAPDGELFDTPPVKGNDKSNDVG